jgi:hypothetical protein
LDAGCGEETLLGVLGCGETGDSHAAAGGAVKEKATESASTEAAHLGPPQSDGWETLLESPLCGQLDSLYVLELLCAAVRDQKPPPKGGDDCAEAAAFNAAEAQRRAWWAAMQASRPGAPRGSGDGGDSCESSAKRESWSSSTEAPLGQLLVRLRVISCRQ